MADPLIPEPEPQLEPALPQQGKQPKTSSPGQIIFFAVIVFFIMSRVMGASAAIYLIVVLATIGIVLFVIAQAANATGRKTTDMPWDNWLDRHR